MAVRTSVRVAVLLLFAPLASAEKPATTSIAGAPRCTTSDSRIESLITSKARELGGHEYCQYRIYQALADIDGDKQPDFAVVFTVEGAAGGNGSWQFLAVFSSRNAWKAALTQVGMRGQRVVTAVDGEAGVLTLKTSSYEPRDAMCCPSVKGSARYKLEGMQLQEQKEPRVSPFVEPPVSMTNLAQPITYFEITGPDSAKLAAFYKDLFGWSLGPGPFPGYQSVDAGSLKGGIRQETGAERIFYVKVPDLQAALDRAVALGAKVLIPPTRVPGVVYFALFEDPAGNRTGLIN